jgi:hypothetical protein
LVNTALGVGTLEVIKIQQELHDTFELRARVGNQVFVSHDVNGVATFIVAVAQHCFEVASVRGGLISDPPVPPLRVVLIVTKLGLGSMRHSIAERSKGKNDIKRVSDATNYLVRVKFQYPL